MSIEIEHKFTADQKIVSVAAGSHWMFENGAGMVCKAKGSGWYGADVRSEDIDLVISLVTLGTRGFAYYYELRGVAHCKQGFHPPPTNRLSLAQACLIVSHHPFGGFPSFTRWVLRFVPATLANDARAFLTADGVNNGQACPHRSTARPGRSSS